MHACMCIVVDTEFFSVVDAELFSVANAELFFSASTMKLSSLISCVESTLHILCIRSNILCCLFTNAKLLITFMFLN